MKDLEVVNGFILQNNHKTKTRTLSIDENNTKTEDTNS